MHLLDKYSRFSCVVKYNKVYLFIKQTIHSQMAPGGPKSQSKTMVLSPLKYFEEKRKYITGQKFENLIESWFSAKQKRLKKFQLCLKRGWIYYKVNIPN